MRSIRFVFSFLLAGPLALLGVGLAAASPPAPGSGPVAGGTDVTVTAPQGVPFTQISAGDFHSLAVGNDGNTYAWGSNDNGQLGDGTLTVREVPTVVQAPVGVTFTQIAGGGNHSLALGSDGNTYAWGSNGFGQLGDGTTTSRDVPVLVQTPVGVSFSQIAAGSEFSLALGSDGNNEGELGDGTNVNKDVPVLVQALVGVSFTQLAVGGNHSLALGNDGNTYAWGYNVFGQLGDGTTTNQNVPVMVQAPSGVRFTQVTGGVSHSLALGDDGNTYAWGENLYGQLGDGTATDHGVPVMVQAPAGVSFTQIVAGGYHSLAFGDDGNTYAWGQNAYGALGDGTTTDREVPVPVLSPGVVVVTDVLFGGVAGTNLRNNGDGTFTVATPAQASCAVDVSLAWTFNGVAQAPVVYPGGFTYLGAPVVIAPTVQSVLEGGAVTFTSSASGCPVASLAWEVSRNGGATWESVSAIPQASVSADGTVLSIAPAPYALTGYLFRSVASNSEGATASESAALTVREAGTISFSANGGLGTMADLVGAVGDEVTLPVGAFGYPGFVFTGWNTSADGSGTSYADGASLTYPVSTVTLYAQWATQPPPPSFDVPSNLETTGSNPTVPLAIAGALIVAGLVALLVMRQRKRNSKASDATEPPAQSE